MPLASPFDKILALCPFSFCFSGVQEGSYGVKEGDDAADHWKVPHLFRWVFVQCLCVVTCALTFLEEGLG